MDKPTVFVDSSVIIAALLSPQGGSFYILTQCADPVTFHVNEYVLAEIQEVLRGKFAHEPELATELFLLLGIAGIAIMPNPSRRDVIAAARFVEQNDAPILASALRSSDYLITLDNGFLTERVVSHAGARKKPLVIVKPKEFLEELRTQEAA